MLIKKPADIVSSEITDKALFLSRRRFLKQAAVAGAAVAGLAAPDFILPFDARAGEKLANVQKSRFSIDEKQTPFKDITTYNNFYEFGTDKYSPAQYAKSLQPRPWTVEVGGEANKPKRYDIDEIMKSSPLSRVTRSKNGSYVLAKLVMLAFHTFGDLMVLPAAKEFGVSRKEILDEPWPKLLKDLEAAFSQALGTAAIFAPKEKHPPRLVK